MKLYKLIKNINCRTKGNLLLEITGLYHNNKEVKDNGLFFCLRGTKVDGSDFVFSAINNGAVAIVTEQEVSGVCGITQIIVKNAREAMSLIASNFYNNPSKKLKIIGITGTNGKTTTTNMIASVLNFCDKKSAIIGTNGIKINEKTYETGLTTPDPIVLHKYLNMFVKKKIEYVVMEVSAHAMDLLKIAGLHFLAVVFTNLTEDHLDYFKTMEVYFSAKSKLFTQNYSNLAVINKNDEYGKRLIESIKIPYVTYAINENADFWATDICLNGSGQVFSLNNYLKINLQMAGVFNVANALSAIAVLKFLDISEKDIVGGLSQMNPVDGRFNTFLIDNKLVIVDYAHTPDGLKNILLSARQLAKDKKVFVVFGCGGNRDSQKRPIMGDVASSIADFVILTTDNPRFESRDQIINDIAKGITKSNFIKEPNRKIAIQKSLQMANMGDVVVIAGKGSEPYIDENGKKSPYSDIDEIKKYMR